MTAPARRKDDTDFAARAEKLMAHADDVVRRLSAILTGETDDTEQA